MSHPANHVLYSVIALGLLAVQPACNADPQPLEPDDLASAFTTAGFQQDAEGSYIRCREDRPTLSYVPGRAEVADLNGDGVSELWITESSVFCYGNAGSAFVLLARDGAGWRTLLDEAGMQVLLETRHDGWPDIEVGGPGFSKFPVYRWNGHRYELLE